MAKIRKNISIQDTTDKTIKEIARAEMRTESAVIELAIKQYAAKRKAAAIN
ncbi:MAG: ribbon-helix-helix protein, CopG family [Saprospiraceae bacterium]